MEFTLIHHIPKVANAIVRSQFNSTSPIMSPLHQKLANQTFWPSDNSKSFQTISSSDLDSWLHFRDTFFCKGRKVIETSLKRSCLGVLYLANAEAIQTTCKFKVAEAQEKIFRASREHMGRVLSWNHWHQSIVLDQELDQTKAGQIQLHHINRSKMLHPDNAPCHLCRWIEDIRDWDEDHWLGWELIELFWRDNTEAIHLAI